MARSAIVRSVSLAPDEAALADQLAEQIAGGSFTELTRLFLHWFGEPLSRRLKELIDAGIDPHEELVLRDEGLVSGKTEWEDFYRPANPWPEAGPIAPPSYDHANGAE